jgi:hypothetical protein
MLLSVVCCWLQCGKLEPLSCFKQGTRSCRKGLAKRRQNLASKQEQRQERQPLRQRQQPERQNSTNSSQPASGWSAFSRTNNNSGSALGFSMEYAVSEHDDMARTGSSNTACSYLGPLAAAAGSPAVAQQQAPGLSTSSQQQQLLLQQLAGSAAGPAAAAPLVHQQLLLRQQLASKTAAAATQLGPLMLHQQQQLLLQQRTGRTDLAQQLSSVHCHSNTQQQPQQLVVLLPQQLPGNTAAPVSNTARVRQQQQQQQSTPLYSGAAMPFLLPVTAAGPPQLAVSTSMHGLHPASAPGWQDSSAPLGVNQFNHPSVRRAPVRVSSTGSSGFAGLVGQASMAAAAGAAYAALSGECLTTATAADPVGPAGLSDLDCAAEAGSGFTGPEPTLTEAELDALLDEELMTPGMQLDSSTPTAATAAAATVGAPLHVPIFTAPNFSSIEEGLTVGAGPAGFALLDEIELDAIIEQEMLAAGMLVPAGSGSSGYVLASAPSGTADTQFLQPMLPSPAAATALPAPSVNAMAHIGEVAVALPTPGATAPWLQASVPAVAAAGGGMEPFMSGVTAQAQLLPAAAPAAPAPAAAASVMAPPGVAGLLQTLPLLPATGTGPLPAVEAPAMAAAAAAGHHAVVPHGAPGLLHAAQCARLDALISELVDLTTTMQQQQGVHLQQQSQGALHGQVDSSMQSYCSMADTMLHNSL